MNESNFTPTAFKYLLILLLSYGSAFSQEKPFACGTKDHDAPQEVMRMISGLPAIMAQQNARANAGETRICRIAVDIDSDTYVKYQRDTVAIIQKVIENIEKASKFFERETNIRLMVTSIRIFKDGGPDPYAGQSDIYALLYILANNATEPNFDKKLYLYTKPVTGGFTGLAFLGAPSTCPRLKISSLSYTKQRITSEPCIQTAANGQVARSTFATVWKASLVTINPLKQVRLRP
jgi:hypothetical protein